MYWRGCVSQTNPMFPSGEDDGDVVVLRGACDAGLHRRGGDRRPAVAGDSEDPEGEGGAFHATTVARTAKAMMIEVPAA